MASAKLETRYGRTRPRKIRIVVTSGPTREYFDSVRYISNASSGKMGYAIAEEARKAGHWVTLVTGPTSLTTRRGIDVVRVESAAQMLAATQRAFLEAHAGVFAAAVSDYRPAIRGGVKAAKSSRIKTLKLEPTEDIAAEMGRIKGGRVTIGFALEDHNGRAHAAKKLARKKFDAIVLNGPENIGVDLASADVLDKSGRWQRWPRQTKKAMARRIVEMLEKMVEKKRK